MERVLWDEHPDAEGRQGSDEGGLFGRLARFLRRQRAWQHQPMLGREGLYDNGTQRSEQAGKSLRDI